MVKEEKNIIRLSDLSDEGKQKVLNFIEKSALKAPCKSYNENGLRFDIEYLNSIGCAPLLLPLELMAEYVDVITKQNIDSNDKEFISEFLKWQTPDILNINHYNATGIGNIAYVALNCKRDKPKVIAMQLLETLYVKYVELLFTQAVKGQIPN